MKFTTIDDTGEPISIYEVPDDDTRLANTTDGTFSVDGPPPDFNSYYLDGVWIAKPAKPSEECLWDKLSKTWIDPRTLQDFKDAQWGQIKQARSAAEYTGFTWDGSTFDSDAISQNRITGAVTLATLSSTFTIGWILADNTVRTLSATDMMQVGAALGQHVATQFVHGATLRAQIDAATTPLEVEAVSW